MGKIVDEYKLGRVNNTVSFFFFLTEKREPGLNSVCGYVIKMLN